MNYRFLGHSGLEVSEISLGSWTTIGGTLTKEQSTELIDKAMELGINHFDTANVYPLGLPNPNSKLPTGESEKILGTALKKYSRDSYVISTKVYFPVNREGLPANNMGLSRKQIIHHCNESLKRLGTDYIDVYYCHRFDDYTPLEETLRALDDLVRAGKILYIGVSNWTNTQLKEANKIINKSGFSPIIANQIMYNLFSREAENDLIPNSQENGTGIVAFSPLARGVLTGKYKNSNLYPKGTRGGNPDTKQFASKFLKEDYINRSIMLNEIAGERNMTLAQLSLAFLLDQQAVSTCLIGATSTKQLEENCLASDIAIDNDLRQMVMKVLKNRPTVQKEM
ncbi:aldo/keto reductase [Halobacillus litoralis]|uniref:Aldo/keto reductase n=1 Tax=Halobacillus litoralis TaxID=45668 RepID=A0A410MJ30_9BACI|nr:aldo/keto reductase [Halobacillus litoralis]QAS54737.1 aldo/keto reductase [Halobacillus litoralis]